MPRKANGPVVWDGEAYRVLPEDKDGAHAALTMDEIRKMPRAVFNEERDQFELAEKED